MPEKPERFLLASPFCPALAAMSLGSEKMRSPDVGHDEFGRRNLVSTIVGVEGESPDGAHCPVGDSFMVVNRVALASDFCKLWNGRVEVQRRV